MKQIFLSDQTLQILARAGGAPLLFREKTAIAALLDQLGADRIELPPVTNFKEDRIIGSTIAAAVKGAALAIPAGTTKEAVAEAWQCVSAAQTPVLTVALPVSTLKMEYNFHLKEKGMLALAEQLIAEARALCPHVEFAALDATRADPAFLREICKAAQAAGAASLCLCDGDGELLPEDFGAVVRGVKEAVDLPLYVNCCDALGLAAAQAAAAVAAGADGLVTAGAGTGGLSTAAAVRLLNALGEALNACCRMDGARVFTDMAELRAQLDRDALAQAQADEPADAVYLDGDSTLPELALAAEKLGYELTEEDLGQVLKALKQVCERKSTVGKKELEALIATYAMQAPSAYHLDSYLANCGNRTASLARVSLLRDGQALSGVSDGDGPIDASFRAIEQAVGSHYELDDFQIQTITEGTEALGAALVRLRSNGKLYSGNGISTDIVGASIRAYLNALNKIVYEENGQ